LIQQEMGQGRSGTPAFDINSTCLSFVAGLDAMSCMIEAGRYRNVLLVSSEIASKGLNWADKESAALFGDGAVAAVIGPASEQCGSQTGHSPMVTYGIGAGRAQIRGGGSKMRPREYRPETDTDYLFAMDGKAIYRMASQLLPPFVAQLLSDAQ